MKKFIFLLALSASLFSFGTRLYSSEEILKTIPDGTGRQDLKVSATLTASSRLFASREDLTSVILVVPTGSVVDVLGSDSTYYKIIFDGSEGFIYKRHAVIDTIRQEVKPVVQQKTQPPENQDSRLAYLQKKYGSEMANRLYTGKIWKGMTSQMIQDSWGTPLKVNSSVNTNPVRYEWVYKTSSLYIENNTLVDWGPVRRQ